MFGLDGFTAILVGLVFFGPPFFILMMCYFFFFIIPYYIIRAFVMIPYFIIRTCSHFTWYCSKFIIRLLLWPVSGTTSCLLGKGISTTACNYWFGMLVGIAVCVGVRYILTQIDGQRRRVTTSWQTRPTLDYTRGLAMSPHQSSSISHRFVVEDLALRDDSSDLFLLNDDMRDQFNSPFHRHRSLTSSLESEYMTTPTTVTPLSSGSRLANHPSTPVEDNQTSQSLHHQPQCNTCSRKFGAPYSLRQHQVTLSHVGLRCSCNQSFTTNLALKKHLSNHKSPVVSKSEPAIGLNTAHQSSQTITCAVCLNFPGPITATACGHLFCRDCITRSIAEKPECPTCRRYIAVRELRDIYS